MSDGIELRDRQTATEQAWHNKTHVVDTVTRRNSMPWDVIESPIFYEAPILLNGEPIYDDFGERKTEKRKMEDQQILVATDDGLPIGQPYGRTYHPSDVATFWNVLKKGMGTTPFKIMSAGSINDRQKIFASIKVTDGFQVGDRKFEDFITIIDSFDKTTSFQCRYTSVCVVCANTYAAAMNSGNEIGRAKHTLNLEVNLERLVKSINGFVGVSEQQQEMLAAADQVQISKDEARAWFAGVEGRNMKETTNGLVQKVARMTELFEHGKGNQGRTRLDAFSAFTEFHTHESTNRKEDTAQYMSSEWGSSAQTKRYIAQSLNQDFNHFVKSGEGMLNDARKTNEIVMTH